MEGRVPFEERPIRQVIVQAIIVNSKGEILFLEPFKKRELGLPGGKCKQGEDAIDGLLREVFEETNLPLGKQSITQNLSHSLRREVGDEKYIGMVDIIMTKLIRLPKELENQPIILSREHKAAYWMTREQVLETQRQRKLLPLKEEVKEALKSADFKTFI